MLACRCSATWLHFAAIAKGLLRELNPGPLAPEARIMPLDQAASWKRAALSPHRFPLLWFRFCFQIGCWSMNAVSRMWNMLCLL